MSQLTLFLTGEGPTDIGTRDYPDGEFVPGEMAYVAMSVIKMYEPDLTIKCHFTSEGELTKLVRGAPSFKRQSVVSGRGVKGKEFSGFWLRARVFAIEVCVKEKPERGLSLAILFSDTDGTHSAPLHQCEKKFSAILNGFEAGGCEYGVPMVPRPKSEAWLIAYYQKNKGMGSSPYQNCKRFEELAGNDDAKPRNSAKHILVELLGGIRPNGEELKKIDWSRVDMPSFNMFKERIREVLAGDARE